MAVRRHNTALEPTAVKQSLMRHLAQSDHSNCSTLPPLQLLEKLKSLHMSIDEGTQRHISSRSLPINYTDFVDSLEFDAKLNRWRIPEAMTPLVQLSRNTQISGSNTCLNEDRTEGRMMQANSSREVLDCVREEVKALGRKLAEDGIDVQHVYLLRSQLQKFFSPTRKLPLSDFKSICSRYRQNPISNYADLIGKALTDDEGFVSEDAVEGLVMALKYTNVYGKALHEVRHPESHCILLPCPQADKKLERFAFLLQQKYRSLTTAFQRFDRDHDGVVSWKDFSEAVEELNTDMTENDIQEVFSVLDPSSRGNLTFDQFSRVKNDSHLPKLPSPRFPRYSSVPLEANESPPSRLSGPQSSRASPNRLYFGQRRPQRQELPSDRDPTHVYGSRTLYCDDIKDLITNSYERQFLDKLRQKQSDAVRRGKRQGKLLTNAVVLRNEAIRERLRGRKPKRN